MPSQKRQIHTLLAGILAVVAFFIFSSMAVVWANGLRFNPETKRFEQTSVIAVDSTNKVQGLTILLNGQEVSTEVPFEERNLVPGYYEIQIQKEGYYPWRQTFVLRSGEVGLIEEYVPIAEEPHVTVIDEPLPFVGTSIEVGLSVSDDGELLDRGKLVTRLIGNPLIVRRLETGYLYQVDNQLRIFFTEGPHDVLVYTLQSTNPAELVVYARDWEVLVKDGDSVKRIQLQIPTPTL